jgi:acylpyruvate hydrolase
MKLLSFSAGGRDWFGAASGDSVVALNDRVGQPSLRAALAAGATEAMRQAAKGTKPDYRLSEIKFLPVIPRPAKILCAGINYRSHAAETGRELPKQPSMFIRFPDTLVGHEGGMIRPNVSDNFDFEGELAVIIGTGGRAIAAERALDHVAGYAVANDVSMRDYQYKTHQWLQGKAWDASTPVGPDLVTLDENTEPLTLRTFVNDEKVQEASTQLLIFDVPTLVSVVSEFATIEPGDLILTGTPGGVGYRREPQLLLKDGDVVAVEVDGIGRIENRCVADQA